MHSPDTTDRPKVGVTTDPRHASAIASFLTRPAGLILVAVAGSALVAALTYYLAQPLLPPVPQVGDAVEASIAVVATVLIPGVTYSLIASILFLILAVLLAWQSGRMQEALQTGQARQKGTRRGVIRIGLGDRALGTPLSVAGLVALVMVYAVLLAYLQFRNFDDFFGAVFRAGTFWRVAAFLVFGLLAPVAEEMMFRGWLWTALRRHWGGFLCTFVTGFLWVLTHFAEGPAKMAILAPVALLLGIARQSSASLRGPILLHLALNLTGLAAPFLLRATGLG
ncbi:MAG TPA: CPBP family intramembrane glutamic endopeptidase [Candidatus Nitrosotalea sp.]|jgi:membrane protease YdiL (CAAX protease family)|nr:CPBP family intramembrane glutamic endopeptidase [Candidatus Nitrosotalea sp.]